MWPCGVQDARELALGPSWDVSKLAAVLVDAEYAHFLNWASRYIKDQQYIRFEVDHFQVRGYKLHHQAATQTAFLKGD
jgi:hypothetical protein